MRATQALVAGLAVVSALAGCGASPHSASPQSMSAAAITGHRASYGGLSVIIPTDWRVVHAPPPPCVGARDTFYISTVSQPEPAVGCLPIALPSPSFGTLTCFVGTMNGPVTHAHEISLSGGRAYRNGNTIYVPGRTGLTELSVVGAVQLVDQVLRSAQRSGRGC